MSKKVLFIANHRLGRSPGQRFRFEQYLDFLKQNGYEWTLSNIISEEDDNMLYQKGNYFKKAKLARKAWKRRMNDVNRADEYDIVFIFREALLTGSSKFEKAFAKSKAKVIFDFDDAIWLPNVSQGNKSLQKLKKPQKTNDILKHVDMVFAGNEYLADYAKKYVTNVKVIPTTIDTEYHKNDISASKDRICIGWTGTQTTMKYLYLVEDALRKLKSEYGDKLCIKIISDTPWEVKDLEIINVAWQRSDEIDQLQEIDIGLMPLLDDEWSKGKCGFKALQYMAMQAVPVVSPVGVNKEIVHDTINGFWADNSEDWYRKLSLLIEDQALRLKMGEKARQSVKETYSVEANKGLYLKYFNELLN